MKRDFKHLASRFKEYRSIPESPSRRPTLWKSFFTVGGLALLIFFVVQFFGKNEEALLPETVQSPPVETKPGEQQLAAPLKLPPRASVPVQVIPTEEQSEDVATSTQPQKQIVTVKRGQNLSIIFSELGLKASLLDEIVALKGVRASLAKLTPGQQLEFQWDENRVFQSLRLPVSAIENLHIRYDQGVLQLDSQKLPQTTRTEYGAGTINSSLYWAAHKAGVSDKLILQMAEIFAWDIDFLQDVQPGDKFQLLYETVHAGNKKVKDGNILVAEFTNQGQAYKVVRYLNKNGEASYYTANGRSVKKAFLRAPVAFSRISSHFGSARKHPILHTIRAHKGVDYAAPMGTPIRAAGNGKVAFVGTQGGYGNTVILEHGGKYTTLYAHLQKFTKGLHAGKRVKQNETIGYIGKSGLATGPHLHYEFRVNGVHKNPITAPLPQAEPIYAGEKQRFQQQAKSLLAQLETRERNYAKLDLE